MKTSEKENGVSADSPIQTLTVSKDGVDTLTFTRCEDESILSGYKPVLMDESSKLKIGNAFSTTANVCTQSAIVANAANGLYRATASPALLMQYSDGTRGSILQIGGQIKGHAGFKPVGAEVFTPMIVFQLLSIVTGQYYMHGISKQLSAIQETLDQIIKDREDERQSKMIAIYKGLKKDFLSSINTPVDLVGIKRYIDETDELFQFYVKKRLDYKAKSEEKRDKTRDDFSSLEAWLFYSACSETSTQKLLNQKCIDAYKLHLLSKLVYFKALVSVSTRHEEYTAKIAECYNDLVNADHRELKELFNDRNNQIEKIRKFHNIKVEDVISVMADTAQNSSQKSHDEALQLLDSVISYLESTYRNNSPIYIIGNAIQENQRQMAKTFDEINSILEPITRKQEILIGIDDGKAELYVLE
jgi:hypothetical protein